MNFVDALFIILLLCGLAVGFFQGTIRLLVAIVAFYVSIVLASLYFGFLASVYLKQFSSSVSVSQISAFATILLVSFLILGAAGLYTFRYAKMPSSLDFIDRIIGTMLGLIMGALFLGMFAVFLTRMFIDTNTAGTLTWPIMRAFQRSVQSSFLVAFFRSNILPLIFLTVEPILPEQSNIIFKI